MRRAYMMSIAIAVAAARQESVNAINA